MRTSAECKVEKLPSTLAPQAAKGFWEGLLTQMLRLVHVIRNRIAVNHMTELDDHMLNDIGLKRSDVTRALGAAIGDDPSHELTRSSIANAKMRFRSGL